MPRSKLDTLLWALILTLILAGSFANYYFSGLAWPLRFAGWIILICILLGLTLSTERGKKTWEFAKSAKMEMLKVVWPKREDTIKITMVVAGLVLVMSVILWGIDSVLLRVIGWLTGII